MKKNPTAIALLESLENYITDLKEYFDNPVDDVEEIRYDVTDKAENLLEEFNAIVGQTKTSYE
jgi:flagellar hook-associated protein FlgK